MPPARLDERTLGDWWMVKSRPATVSSSEVALESMKPRFCEGGSCANSSNVSRMTGRRVSPRGRQTDPFELKSLRGQVTTQSRQFGCALCFPPSSTSCTGAPSVPRKLASVILWLFAVVAIHRPWPVASVNYFQTDSLGRQRCNFGKCGGENRAGLAPLDLAWAWTDNTRFELVSGPHLVAANRMRRRNVRPPTAMSRDC